MRGQFALVDPRGYTLDLLTFTSPSGETRSQMLMSVRDGCTEPSVSFVLCSQTLGQFRAQGIFEAIKASLLTVRLGPSGFH